MSERMILPEHALDFDALDDARVWVNDRMEDGSSCPCCGQWVRLNKFSIQSTVAYALIHIDAYFMELDAASWLHVRQFVDKLKYKPTNIPMLRHWGILERREGEKEDGNPRLGEYRITPLGHQYAQGNVSLPEFLYYYNDTPYRLDGPLRDIKYALGDAFNYEWDVRR